MVAQNSRKYDAIHNVVPFGGSGLRGALPNAIQFRPLRSICQRNTPSAEIASPLRSSRLLELRGERLHPFAQLVVAQRDTIRREFRVLDCQPDLETNRQTACHEHESVVNEQHEGSLSRR